MFISILGRQPELSLAELEARFGAESVQPLSTEAALLRIDNIDINRFGGSQKIIEVLDLIQNQPLTSLPNYLVKLLPASNHKINLGVSWYGRPVNGFEIKRLALQVKKVAKSTGHKLRVVPNQTAALSTAQVLHNDLTKNGNIELSIITDSNNQIYLGRTLGIQDIEAYRRRDIERPARDARVGMLPPKLAQIMLNLAQVTPEQIVLDPFCGTGVVLQEAILLGARAYGTDLAEAMVRKSQTNLEWLAHNYSLPFSSFQLEQADARVRKWLHPIDAVVSELYLGPPLLKIPSPIELAKIQRQINDLLQDTLTNLRSQLAEGSRLVLALPAWRSSEKFITLPLVDQIEAIGYTGVRFKHAPSPLIYAREGQLVARQLLVVKKS